MLHVVASHLLLFETFFIPTTFIFKCECMWQCFSTYWILWLNSFPFRKKARDVLSLSSGVKYVFDTTLAASFSILESQREFIQRYRRRHSDVHAMPMFTSSCPGKLIPMSVVMFVHVSTMFYST